MATLTPASAAAIARLRSYIPPPTTWHSLPLTRRAAVLILLFADKRGDLRVVLTMRAATLKSYAGQAALPGGKSDSLAESPLETARREAWEEIGLPLPESGELLRDTAADGGASTTAATPSLSLPKDEGVSALPASPGLPYPFKLEHLCQLPTNLAKTELGVRPCVAFLYATSPVDKNNKAVDVESMLIPRLDAKEVAAVFNGRFHNFLKLKDEVPVPSEGASKGKGRDSGQWYKGQWTDWHETQFRMHNFFVPVHDQIVTRPKSKNSKKNEEARAMAEAVERANRESSQSDQTTYKDLHGRGASASASASSPSSSLKTRSGQYPRPSSTIPYRDIPHPDEPDPIAELSRFRVFGMTARILVDCARVAYREEPEFEHNSHFGDEAIIQRLLDMGRMGNERGRGDEFDNQELAKVVSGQTGFGGLVQGNNKRRKTETDERGRL